MEGGGRRGELGRGRVEGEEERGVRKGEGGAGELGRGRRELGRGRRGGEGVDGRDQETGVMLGITHQWNHLYDYCLKPFILLYFVLVN